MKFPSPLGLLLKFRRDCRQTFLQCRSLSVRFEEQGASAVVRFFFALQSCFELQVLLLQLLLALLLHALASAHLPEDKYNNRSISKISGKQTFAQIIESASN